MIHNGANLIGQRFTKLLVTGLAYTDERGNRVWECVCDCGGHILATTVKLRHRYKSCGCLVGRHGPITHGKTGTRVWNIWAGMLGRCYVKTSGSYRDYGARGITVCERWKTFENFYVDMGDPPDKHSIDRINNDGNYEPGNCRWATSKEQRANQRPRRTR